MKCSISFCICLLFLIAINSFFTLFWRYDSQNRLLDPQHYNIDVITQEDYKQLSDPENRTVKLSNGHTLTKSDTWDGFVLGKYKSVNNGSQYALVTIRGTAAFMHQWISCVLPIVCFCIVGLFYGIKQGRQMKKDR